MKLNSDIRRLMLIFPPSTSLTHWEPMVCTPMGLAYLAAAAREMGYEVSCLDAVAEDHYQSFSISDTLCRYGLSFDQIMERVRQAQPDVVGISCIFSNQWPAVREIAARVKAEFPEMIVMSGGAHPTFMSERCMRDAPLDFIIRGEGEDSFLALLSRLKSERPVDDVDGLAWRDGDNIRINPKTGFIHDLDSMPFPAHDLLPSEKYFKAALPMAFNFMHPRNLPVVTSRGCPCSCTFCSSTNLWGSYRARSADSVLKELDWLVERFGVREIKFQDDNLTIDRKRAKALFQGMIERPYYLHWNTPNGIAVWTLDEELLGLMKRSGCFEITMAIESGNQEVLSKLINKPLKLDKIREVNRLARKAGIARGAYFIVGLPGETKAQIMDTVNFERELKLDFNGIFIYNPLPGSALFNECLERGFITVDNFFEAGNHYAMTL
jgi:magnesium-protoporphyrin IX monomethyl ester (oxidative) cyclase